MHAHVRLQLYSLHRGSASRKGVMEYFHLSKSGGTSWCHAARKAWHGH